MNWTDKVTIIKGDITKQRTQAIVNAANSSLLGGGGVDGAIHRAAGPGLLQECRTLNGCPTGDAKITKGYQLPADYVIHTVGPVWHGGKHNEDLLLANCYQNSLKLATEHHIKSISFPAISTGVYHFPLERATRIAMNQTKTYLDNHEIPENVVFVCFSDSDYQLYNRIYNEIFM